MSPAPVDQKMTPPTVELTEDEAELYDRQIRLWGVESQKRLRASKVLIIGVQGVGAEIAKNIILSGVKSVCLLDSGIVTKEDVNTSQFLIPHENIGQNRAVSSKVRAQNLNPNVEVTSNETSVGDLKEEFIHGFDIVIATGCSKEQIISIDQFCRTKKPENESIQYNSAVKLFTADVFGMFGFGLSDLHQYTWLKGDSIIKNKEDYLPLKDVLNIDLNSDEEFKKIALKNPAYLLFLVLNEFRQKYGRYTQPENRAEDIENLKVIRNALFESLLEGEPNSVLPDEYFTNVFSKLSPVCAIIAGIVCQEVTAAIAQKQVMFNNMFLFSPVNHIGFFFKATPSSAKMVNQYISKIDIVDEIL